MQNVFLLHGIENILPNIIWELIACFTSNYLNNKHVNYTEMKFIILIPCKRIYTLIAKYIRRKTQI